MIFSSPDCQKENEEEPADRTIKDSLSPHHSVPAELPELEEQPFKPAYNAD